MDMLMGKEMILTILVISIAFGTVTELQIVSVQFGTPAHSTFMHGLSAVPRRFAVFICRLKLLLSR